MNVYDCANELAKAMRDSQEYKKLKEAKAALSQDPKGKELAEEFLQLSQEIELAKYQGQEVPEEKNEKLQKAYRYFRFKYPGDGVSACLYAFSNDDGRYFQIYRRRGKGSCW